MKIPILYDDELLKLGFEKEIMWEPDKAPHMIIIGTTGSGKTYLSKTICGKIAIYEKDSEIFVCDFKGDDDFAFLQGSQNFYRFTECAEGLNAFYERFLKRQKGVDKARNMLALFFDEWASYLTFIDKKQAEQEKNKMSLLLLLSRSFNLHIIISQARADAQYFGTVRDCLNVVIGLHNLSETSKEMMFNEFRHEMLPDRTRGTGYMTMNSSNLRAVYAGRIKNMDKLHRAIKEAVDRSNN